MKVNVDATQLDNLTKFFAEMPGKNERARNSAMSTIGFNLKSAAKDGIKNNSFGWPQIRNITRMATEYPARTTTDARGRTSSSIMARDNLTTSTVKKMWGSLAGLLVYSVEKTGADLLFGFSAGTYGTRKGYTRSDGAAVRVANVISKNVIDIAKKLTEGFTYIVGTGPKGDAQRRYFASLGFIFPKFKVMNIPERPLVGPTFEAKRAQIPTWFADKFWERLRKYCG